MVWSPDDANPKRDVGISYEKNIDVFIELEIIYNSKYNTIRLYTILLIHLYS